MTSKKIHWPLSLSLLIAIAILAISLWGTALWVDRAWGPLAANGIYMIARLIVIVGLGYLLSAAHHRSTFSSMSIISFVIFLDQVPMKTLLYLHEQKLDPTQSAPLSIGALLVGFTTAYGLALPIVFAFAYGGRLLHKPNRTQKGIK
ncbi:MAG: hypothetical protein P4M08_04420 [Oligoflexia bacterium]|nr:hypothetical protein [Oligoflexia bacterium]